MNFKSRHNQNGIHSRPKKRSISIVCKVKEVQFKDRINDLVGWFVGLLENAKHFPFRRAAM